MYRFKFLLVFIAIINICYPALAQAEGREGGGNQQSPVQVAITIAATAIVIRILHAFKLP